MQQTSLEPRPLYGIGTVARLTGLKPDTLRIWERRYGLGASRKSASGQRQYTRADLEHLQLVSALVSSGSRIGEIASAKRKTLEMLLRVRGQPDNTPRGEPRPNVLFIGPGLCDWLDDHQGCLASVDAHLARMPLADTQEQDFHSLPGVDLLVVECTNLAGTQLSNLNQLRQRLQAGKVLVTYGQSKERWLKAVASEDIQAVEFPPDPAYLAFEMGRCVTDTVTRQGDSHLGDLVAPRPRQFSEHELSAALRLQSTLDCECPRHLSELIRALAQFEEYSASCSVENWHDAAVHACIFAYTGQARWLMEKALSAVLEERTDEFAQALSSQAGPEGAA